MRPVSNLRLTPLLLLPLPEVPLLLPLLLLLLLLRGAGPSCQTSSFTLRVNMPGFSCKQRDDQACS
jgi:hypothetical protein